MGQLSTDVRYSKLKMLKLIVIFAAISAVCFESIQAAPAPTANGEKNSIISFIDLI